MLSGYAPYNSDTPMGTALTVEQVGLLRRFAGREATVTILFDGDEAGQQAAKRAHSALAEGGLGQITSMQRELIATPPASR